MKKMKIKFQDESGFYYCTWWFNSIENLWARITKEEREYKSNFKQFITD
jgi:hypothetical protein